MKTNILMAILISVLWIVSCSNNKSDILPPAQAGNELVIFHNVNLVPMTGNKILPNHTVIVHGDRIIDIALSSTYELPENAFLPEHYHAIFKQGREKHQVQFKGGEDFAPFKHDLDLLILSYLKASDVFLVLGTDSGTGGMGIVPGYSVHEELRILVENGYTPFEALKTGTVNAGLVVEKMNGQGTFGTIDIGNRADLILLENNPLEDVANVKYINGVMAAGRWYDKPTLDDMTIR